MELASLVTLGFAVFGASFLQAVTGIGYGVIAGPVFLFFLNGSEAFQISTIHNLLIALGIFPFIRADVSRPILKFLILGSIVGISFGFWIQALVDVKLLKIASIAMLGFVTATLIIGMRKKASVSLASLPNPHETILIGALAGAMGGMLAMPGPMAASWMALKEYSKRDVRATVLAFFIFAYGSSLILYLVTTGLEPFALQLSLGFLPILIIGIAAGNLAARRVSESLFRWILLLVLIATIILLFVGL